MKKPKAKQPSGNAQNPTEVDVKITSASWSGPLPPPASLAQFNEIVENGAERIMRQWETESDHRRSVERTEVKAWSRNEILGKILAFLFVIAALGVSALALYLQQPWAAAVVGGGTIVSVVWAFIRMNKKPT